MRLNIFLSLSLFVLSFAHAQNSVKGILYEKGTKNILKDTNVFLLPYKMKATTNNEGQFIFSNVPRGEFRFVVNKAGYLRLDQKVKTSDRNFDLYIEKEFYDVFETVVTGKEVKKDVAKKTLSQKDFLKAPGAQEDPVKAVQNLPGVANQTFSSQVVIQGSAPDDTRYNINGHEIPLIFHFGGLTSVVTPTAVKEVEFLAAGFGPEYGRALGGIINLQTRDARSDRWRGEGFIDITKLGTLVEGPINEKSSLIASARLSYFGVIFEKIAEQMDEFAVTAAPEFKDIYLNYKYQLSKDEQFSMVAIASQDTLKLIVNESNNPIVEGNVSNDTSFFRLIPRYKKKLSDKADLDVSVAVGQDLLEFNLGERFFNLDSTVITNRAELKYQYDKKLTNYLGLDVQLRKFDLEILLPSGNSVGGVGSSGTNDVFAEISGLNTDTAIYLRNIYKLSKKITLSPNLRLEHLSTTGNLYLMPRLNATYALDKSSYLNFATGLYYQGPQNGENSEEFGNPNIEAERSVHFFTSWVKDFRQGATKGLTLEVGAFYKTLDNLIVNTSETRTDGTPLRVDNEGEGSVKGAQVQASYKFDEYTFLMSYTLLDSKRNDPENGDYSSEFDQTHNLNLIGIYEKSRWSYSARLRFVTGGPYTPVIGSTYDSDNDFYIPTRGDLFSDRFSNFFQLDFRIDRKFIYQEWILSAYLDIQNVTNSSNGQSISYSYDYSENEEAAGTPILPIIGLRGEF